MDNNFFLGLIIVMFTAIALQPVPNCTDIPISELSNETPDTTFTKSDILDIHSKLERGYIIIQTLGNSMKGTINTNQRCLCIPKEEYKVGDIVLFLKGGTGIAHEILFETSNGFITKGTNNDFADGEITDSQILCEIGKVNRWKLW